MKALVRILTAVGKQLQTDENPRYDGSLETTYIRLDISAVLR